MTETPTTPEGDISFALKFPGECTEGVDRRGEFQPCDRPAAAVRIDPSEGGAYPVCAFHARAPMVPLEAVFAAGHSQALEEIAELIDPYSGIGLANGATRADVAQWLRARAAAIQTGDKL